MAIWHLDIWAWSSWEQREDITDPFHEHYRFKTMPAIDRGYKEFKGPVFWLWSNGNRVPGFLFLDKHYATILNDINDSVGLTAEVRETSYGYQLVILGSDQAIMLLKLTI